MPPHLHKHCSAPCGINENTRVQAPSRTHTYALALALTLTPCWIVDDSSVFCNGSEIYIKVVLGRWAAKYAHAHIPQRKGFKKGEYKRRETEPGFFFFFFSEKEAAEEMEGVHRLVSLSWIEGCVTAALPARTFPSLLLSSLFSDTQEQKKQNLLKC